MLEHLAAVIAHLGGLWIMAGDFNMEPEDMGGNYWLKSTKGVILCTDEPCGTCRSRTKVGLSCSNIDYFVVHPALAKLQVGVRVMEEWESVPHKPVILELKVPEEQRFVRVLREPRMMPLVEGKVDEGQVAQSDKWPSIPEELGTQGQCDRLWGKLVDAMEDEVMEYARVPEEERTRMVGRGRPRKEVLRRIELPKARNLPRPSPQGRIWRWIASRMAELMAQLQAMGDEPREGQRRQLGSLQATCLRYAGRLEPLGQRRRPWAEVLRAIGGAELRAEGWWQVLQTAMGHAEVQARWWRTQDSREQARGWASFLDRACLGGAGALHRITKPVPVIKPPRTGRHAPRTGDPLSIVEAKRREWGEVWQVGQPAQQAARPWELMLPSGLPPITAQDLEAVQGIFKARTSVGADLIHPRSLKVMSRKGKECLASFLNLVERRCMWPSQAQLLMYILIPKPNGKDRPIVKLPTVLRWREAARANSEGSRAG